MRRLPLLYVALGYVIKGADVEKIKGRRPVVGPLLLSNFLTISIFSYLLTH